MSVIMQRKSSQKLEPSLLPGPYSAQSAAREGSGVPHINMNTIISPIPSSTITDDNNFFRIRPSSWTIFQVFQLFTFLFGCTNLFVARYVWRHAQPHLIHTELDEPHYYSTVDIRALAASAFVFTGVTYMVVGLLGFKQYNALLERNINPMSVLDDGYTNLVVAVSFSLLFGVRQTQHLLLIAFLSVASPVTMLVTEHLVFYAKTMHRMGIRSVQRLELFLPFALATATQAFALITPFVYAEKAPHPGNNTLASIIALYALKHVFIGVWLLTPSLKYERLAGFVALIFFVIKLRFAFALI
jgi:hypothetical protein